MISEDFWGDGRKRGGYWGRGGWGGRKRYKGREDTYTLDNTVVGTVVVIVVHCV